MTDSDRPLPLAAAAARLRRPPGRPRKSPRVLAPAGPESARPGAPARPEGAEALAPRLLDLAATAAYLGVSPWTVRDLAWAGTLRRVRVPLANHGELRKLLFDRQDLDRLIEIWKAG
jgi:hypothetical protein